MKTLKLNSEKLQLKKVKISTLTKEEMTKVQGGAMATKLNPPCTRGCE